MKHMKTVTAAVLDGNAWKKLTNPTVPRGKTAFPKAKDAIARLGVRFDYDGVITKEDSPEVQYHKYQIQPNAGDDVPPSIKEWRKANGGTHAIMANVYIKDDGSKEDVRLALEEAMSQIRGA